MKKNKKKYPLGGINDTNFDSNSPDYNAYGQKEQTANTIQSTAEKIPVYGQLIGMGKQFSETGANMVGRDTSLGKGIIQGRPDQAAAQGFTDLKQGNWGSLAANLATGGASEFAKPFFGQNSFMGNMQNQYQDKVQGLKFPLGGPFYSSGAKIFQHNKLAMEAPYEASGFRSGFYPNGGIHNFYTEGGEANAQIEKQENFITPQGQFGQANGPSHENGGVNLNLPNGTIIFSDKLKPKGSRSTYAQLNKKNDTTKDKEILEDKNSTTEAKKAAKLNITNKEKASLSLFQDQETYKQSKVDAYSNRTGINPDDLEYQDGGIHIKPNKVGSLHKHLGIAEGKKIPASKLAIKESDSPAIKKKKQFAINARHWKHENGGVHLDSDKVYMGGYMFPFGGQTYTGRALYSQYPWGGFSGDLMSAANYTNTDTTNSPTSTRSWPLGQGFNENQSSYDPNYNGFYNNGFNAGYTPQSGNANQAASADMPVFKQMNVEDVNLPSNFKPNTPVSKSSNPNNFNWGNAAYYGAGTLANSAGPLAYLKEQGKKYDTQKFYEYNPSKLDPTAALREHQLQINAANADLSRYNSGNYMANRVALGANNALGQAGIRTDFDNRNNMLANDAQQFNIRNRYMTDDINARNKGQALTNYYNAIGQVGTNTASGMRDYRADKYDQQGMNLLQYIYNNPQMLQALSSTFGK